MAKLVRGQFSGGPVPERPAFVAGWSVLGSRPAAFESGQSMKPYYDDGKGIVIYHGDCREIAPALGMNMAVVTDPPYGVGFDTRMTRFSGGSTDKAGTARGKDWPLVVGDFEQFDPVAWLNYPAVVLWGLSNFSQRVPPGTWLVWTKKPADRYGTFLSDAEIAWMKGGRGIYVKFHEWEGFIGKRGDDFSAHPTQKPVGIMAWSIEKGASDFVILDPFMGSGTTLRAAKDLGRKAIGIEIEEKYCAIAAKRLEQQVLPFEESNDGKVEASQRTFLG